MKKPFFLIVLMNFSALYFSAQNLYNGSFENDTIAICTYSLDNPHFNIQMPHVNAFGSSDNGYYPNSTTKKPTGRISMQDSGCNVTPMHGKWCIGLKGLFDPTYDAVALELDAPLDSGATYYVSYYYYGNVSFHNFECDLNVGVSNYNFLFGTTVNTVTASYLSWKNSRFSFVAPDTSRYITVRAVPGYNSWVQIDNFEISKNPIPVGLEKYAKNNLFRVYPNPAKNSVTLDFSELREEVIVNIFNELGQEILRTTITDPTRSQIDLSEFENGFYTVRVDDANWSVCKKLIVAR